VAPEHARATVVVYALAQVLMPVSRQSPFLVWVLVRAPCSCLCLCFWSSGLARQRHVQSPRYRCPPCLRGRHPRRHRRLRRRVDVRVWRVHSCWRLRLHFALRLGTARGCCGSLAGSKRPACRRRLSNPHGTVHVLRPSRDRVDISICDL
jgi:hypothetical protein